jgi:hypothetical protein
MEPKIFTLEEANSLLLHLNETFSGIFYLNERIKLVSKGLQELIDIWGEQIFESNNPDNKFYFEKLKEREDALHELQKRISEIQKSGCIVKDINEGLVDFYCKRNGELISLCWKYGEDKIKYWHSLQGGFANRKNIEELIQISEKSG